MRSTHRSPARIVLFNLLLCLALCLSFAPAGLADEAAPDETTIHLPLVLRRFVPFIESTGALDTSFGQDGRVLTNFDGGDERGRAVAIQPDGKLVIAGFIFTGSSFDVVVARYHPDGSLDTSFSGDGKVATDVNNGDDYAHAVALQTDGKILVAGYAEQGSDTYFFLLRYDPDGSLDASFDEDGKTMANFIGSDSGQALAVQVDGKILVGGFASTPTDYFALARYNPDGGLDTSFDGDGMLTMDVTDGSDRGFALALQGDGKILMAGISDNLVNDNFALVRLNPDGSLDTTFDSDGKLITDFAGGTDLAYDLAVQSDGKIIAAGFATVTIPDFAMARYNADGSLDTTFDGDGKLTTDMTGIRDGIISVELQTDGKIVAAGFNQYTTIANDDFAVARYNADGSLDTSFDGDGRVITDLAGWNDVAYGLALLEDGRMVAVGTGVFNRYDFGAVRYNADGSLDSTFAEDGILLSDLYGSIDSVAAAALQRDGKVVVVGHTMRTSTDFAIARYNPDGSLDLGFGTQGKVVTDFRGAVDIATSVAVQADGKLLVAGYNYDFILARYNPDGSLDTTFDGDGAVSTDFSYSQDYASAVLIQGDGKYILAGYLEVSGGYDFALARYKSDGRLDKTFGVDGKVVTDLSGYNDYLEAAVLQADGKIVVGGSSDGTSIDFVLARYNTDGSLDASFDGDGLVSTDIDGSFDQCTALVIQPDGKILAAGFTDNPGNYNFALVRYNPDGSLDTTFDGDGKLEADPTGGNDRAFSLALQPNGKIVVAGYGVGTLYDFVVARLNPDGSWDTTFDGDGRLLTDFLANQDYAYAVLVQPNGGIVVAGTAHDIVASDFALVRYK
jgi:uncharacterized delta-60 repeat protein